MKQQETSDTTVIVAVTLFVWILGGPLLMIFFGYEFGILLVMAFTAIMLVLLYRANVKYLKKYFPLNKSSLFPLLIMVLIIAIYFFAGQYLY